MSDTTLMDYYTKAPLKLLLNDIDNDIAMKLLFYIDDDTGIYHELEVESGDVYALEYPELSSDERIAIKRRLNAYIQVLNGVVESKGLTEDGYMKHVIACAVKMHDNIKKIERWSDYDDVMEESLIIAAIDFHNCALKGVTVNGNVAPQETE